MPDMATGTSWSPDLAVSSWPPYCAKPVPSSLSAEILNGWPEMANEAANAPLARPKTKAPAAAVGTATATAKRRQLVRPYAGSPCASFTDPPRRNGNGCDRTARRLASRATLGQPLACRPVDAAVLTCGKCCLYLRIWTRGLA